jgi:hypothetical protein
MGAGPDDGGWLAGEADFGGGAGRDGGSQRHLAVVDCPADSMRPCGPRCHVAADVILAALRCRGRLRKCHCPRTYC